MKEKKNIDRIFQESFKDFETEPREQIWDNIASRLDKKDKKRPLIIPLWLKIGGVAAVMALIMASLLFTDNQKSVMDEPEVVFEKPEKSTKKQDIDEKSTEAANEINESEEQLASDEKNTESGSGQGNSASNNQSSSASAVTRNENKTLQNKNGTAKNIKSTTKTESAITVKEQESKALNDIYKKEEVANSAEIIKNDVSGAVAQSETTENDSIKSESILKQENALTQLEEEKEKGETEEEVIAEASSKKMRLSTFAAPIFYKNIGSGNELSNQFSNNGSSSEVTLSYGVKIAYKISKRLKIRTGISKIDMNNNIQDISYSPSAMAMGFENITQVEDHVSIRDNTPLENGLPITEMDEGNAFAAVFTPGEINQQFGYIEIPLELEYALIDKKFGLNIIGGGSSLFLDNNRVQLISGESKTDLGKATNINSTSFSTNIGLGMDYKLTDKFSISVEPIFKYQINTFDKVNNVQPVNFGVYSGLSFRF